MGSVWALFSAELSKSFAPLESVKPDEFVPSAFIAKVSATSDGLKCRESDP